MKPIWLILLLGGLTAFPVHALELPGMEAFVREMAEKHGFDQARLGQAFQEAQYRQSIIDAMERPATRKPWPEYRAAFINTKRIRGGLQFWQRYADVLQRAEQQYGVPQEIIVALIGVETLYGQQTGRFRTLDALATLAFGYPRRAEFFRDELEQFLLLSREQGFGLLDVQGSYAGALGIPQFMPGSYRRFAVDFNQDGRIDLLHDPEDAIGSVAHYLMQYGWVRGEPVAVRARMEENAGCVGNNGTGRSFEAWVEAGYAPEESMQAAQTARLFSFDSAEGYDLWFGLNNFEVIMRYNNSPFYAMSVYELSEALRARREARD
ncbi:MAG: lytic murein transglycosylase B [Pseudomonadota bacterium]